MGGRAEPPVAAGPSVGLGSLRLIVLIFILLDILTTLISGSTGSTADQPSGMEVGLQMLLVAAAAAAVMWRRRVASLVLLLVVVVATFVFSPTGEELALLLVIGVVSGARAPWRRLGLIGLGLLGFTVAFGVHQERYQQGWGWPAALTVVAFSGSGLTVGLVARHLLRLDATRRDRLRRLELENAEIRARERGRLADDLQSVVTRGLAEIVVELDAIGPGRVDRATSRAGLARIDALSRGLLEELRALLEVLRRDPEPADGTASAVPDGVRRGWSRWLTVLNVRIAATVGFALLLLRVVVEHQTSWTPDLWVQAIGLVACGAALWRPWGTRAGALVAVGVLVFATLSHDTVGWDAVAVALLCLIGTATLRVRRLWVVVVGLVAYGGVRALGPLDDPSKYLSLLGYAGVVGVLLGLATRHFLRSWAESDRRLDDLLTERESVESQERNAVARELHDVVAHQLSVTTLVVMANGASDDAGVLADTVVRVRRSTESARLELDTLLHTMRGADADAVQPTPLASPVSTAAGLRRRLVEQGFRPEFAIDEAADGLDPISQRTLVRIMQEATTNVLRYTAAGSSCRYELALGPDGVALSVVSPMAVRERRSDLSLGWGLRGIRERIDLCHGTFFAGPVRGQWRLAVTLPPPAPDSGDPAAIISVGAGASEASAAVR